MSFSNLNLFMIFCTTQNYKGVFKVKVYIHLEKINLWILIVWIFSLIFLESWNGRIWNVLCTTFVLVLKIPNTRLKWCSYNLTGLLKTKLEQRIEKCSLCKCILRREILLKNINMKKYDVATRSWFPHMWFF